ncbi:ankyrin repeat-containing domain protein [Bombardia bombarda]|uniref:Ankyrin repeat-containing domain protein n=1 Tax=Bombardia bombarda TaxID=252184 RepID=A0AA39XHX6_9PEZI|nr:ankyrin repeat-containing domain protein [Bombardia bombarda]
MDQRISSLLVSPTRRRKKRDTSVPRPDHRGETLDRIYAEESSTSICRSSSCASTRRTSSIPSFDYSTQGSYGPSTSSSTTALGLRQLSIPIRTLEHERKLAPDSSDDELYGVPELQRRLSDCSTHYAEQISTLIRHFSISSSSDIDENLDYDRRPSTGQTEHSEPNHRPDFESVFEALPEPGLALPGDFLSAHDRNCTEFPGHEHGSRRCWCSIAQDTSATDESWLLPTGNLSDRARRILDSPSLVNSNICDPFGNTPLHLFASLEGYQDSLFRIVLNGANNLSIRATNNANQTFLHVLNAEWFSDLTSSSAPLQQLLTFLHETVPDIVYDTDVYGRTFFHRAQSLIRDPETLTSLLSPFNPALVSRRDAFGLEPLPNTQYSGEGSFNPPKRVGSRSPLQDEEMASSSRPGSGSKRYGSPRSPADEGYLLAYHARLVQVIQSSYNNPRVEDAQGRNGLHCLAEAILNQQTMDEQRSVVVTGRPLKRKLDIKDISPTSLSASSSATSSGNEGTLVARLRHVEGLLQSALHPVDVNHYDKQGNTVLMAFITHISDDKDDKAKTLLAIMETLLRGGATIEARNRRGETPLLIAARLGRKVALLTLLEHGANVYARDVDGRGVLEVLDETCRGARDDVALYARLEACRVLLTGRRDWGVMLRPGVVDEWRTRDAASY